MTDKLFNEKFILTKNHIIIGKFKKECVYYFNVKCRTTSNDFYGIHIFGINLLFDDYYYFNEFYEIVRDCLSNGKLLRNKVLKQLLRICKSGSTYYVTNNIQAHTEWQRNKITINIIPESLHILRHELLVVDIDSSLYYFIENIAMHNKEIARLRNLINMENERIAKYNGEDYA